MGFGVVYIMCSELL